MSAIELYARARPGFDERAAAALEQLRAAIDRHPGTLVFTTSLGAFALQLDPAAFQDFFLSMKEFKCLEGPSELMCHVPYPYKHPGTVSDGQLAWLEHGLLFMFKRPSEFGAKLWNGLYFRFERTPQGLRGKAQAVDLNRISAPSATPDIPPYAPALRDEVRAGSRWIETLLIE